MDKETVNRLAEESGATMTVELDADEYWVPNGGEIFDKDALEAFAQACCDWQRVHDQDICKNEEMMRRNLAPEHKSPYASGFADGAEACFEAIRNTKDSPETDLDQAQRIR